MASHRKPRRTTLTGRARRTAATVVGAAAASATVLAPAGNAEPRPAPEQVRAQVDELYQQAEQATQRYDGAKEQTEALQKQVTALQDEVARRAAAMDATRERLGELAAEQYRGGGFPPGFQLALSDDPQQFLQRAGMLDQAGAVERGALEEFGRQRLALDTRTAQARLRLADLDARQRELAAEKATVQDRLSRAQALLAGLTADQRGSLDRASRDASRPDLDPGADTFAVSGRAAEAIAFARAQLGKPYVWGATGPGSYDCSGLVQAAWAAAGVGLPRTTYAQIDAAQRVPRDQLQPGDLVFFYSGVTHVGMYTGGGRMIHAPHPGAPVRYESIDVMPFAGAVRPS
ncbi:NlpC/P60 family protein [Kitasatospora sp. NBC_00240]|uniref:C40 family peptidase n=1 Tax=Kitasatospora sp. NBC_00240 TaxID=2903567 RepID=UPI002258B03A|nr:C40 family peptidase [Kitasatospora sp. NBC_00240]MCX5212460.1 NlpC/P60 family protein [Kitasatospora sp. NBC_00240]